MRTPPTPPLISASTNDPTSLRAVAAYLAVTAGTIALEGRRSGNTQGLTGATKSSKTDLVTEYDRAAEASIVAWLRTNRPNDAIVGEEGTADRGSSGVEWHIDPIDGTTNFVYDLPAWACSVGAQLDGAPVAGAVYAPALDELFTAAAGGGASLNDRPISVSNETDIELALVATGFNFSSKIRTGQAAVVSKLISQVRDIRRYGAAALDLCFVACGRLDVYYEQHLNSWDVVAGAVIAAEAGAIVSDFGGAQFRPEEMLVATPQLHNPMMQLLESATLST